MHFHPVLWLERSEDTSGHWFQRFAIELCFSKRSWPKKCWICFREKDSRIRHEGESACQPNSICPPVLSSWKFKRSTFFAFFLVRSLVVQLLNKQRKQLVSFENNGPKHQDMAPTVANMVVMQNQTLCCLIQLKIDSLIDTAKIQGHFCQFTGLPTEGDREHASAWRVQTRVVKLLLFEQKRAQDKKNWNKSLYQTTVEHCFKQLFVLEKIQMMFCRDSFAFQGHGESCFVHIHISKRFANVSPEVSLTVSFPGFESNSTLKKVTVEFHLAIGKIISTAQLLVWELNASVSSVISVSAGGNGQTASLPPNNVNGLFTNDVYLDAWLNFLS